MILIIKNKYLLFTNWQELWYSGVVLNYLDHIKHIVISL